jgi:hypothetical protein
MIFAIKTEVRDPRARTFAFSRQKTMYGGKRIEKGDTIFVFASENEGGSGLIASGVVTSAEAVQRRPGIARQTPCVSITVRRTALARRRLGRGELRPFSDWNDGRPETELNFKFYRQGTNKIAGISDETARYLRGYFSRGTTMHGLAPRASRRRPWSRTAGPTRPRRSRLPVLQRWVVARAHRLKHVCGHPASPAASADERRASNGRER